MMASASAVQATAGDASSSAWYRDQGRAPRVEVVKLDAWREIHVICNPQTGVVTIREFGRLSADQPMLAGPLRVTIPLLRLSELTNALATIEGR